MAASTSHRGHSDERKGRGEKKKPPRPGEDKWCYTRETDEIASAGGKLRRVSEEVMKRR